MHLLYLDDSGSAGNPNEEYLVLAGVSVFEAQVYWATNQLDKLAETIRPDNPHGVEFHASEIFSRRVEPWKSLTRDEARAVIASVLGVLEKAYESARAFACVVHKPSFPNRDPMELAFEDLCSRFDMFLARLNRSGDDTQRGLIILDESTSETALQKMSVRFRTEGTRWGNIKNLTETPLFVDSKACRLVQLADHIAYSVFRYFHAEDMRFFNRISHKFDAHGGVYHGLSHKELGNPQCTCPGCLTRRTAQELEPVPPLPRLLPPARPAT